MTPAPRTTGAGKQLSRTARAKQPKQLSPEEIAAQDHVRRDVARTLRMYGLAIKEHLAPPVGEDVAIHVRCRLATANPDRELVYAVLDDHGWNPDRTRLSRFRGEIDTVRLCHGDTGAQLVVVIRIPTGSALHSEAA